MSAIQVRDIKGNWSEELQGIDKRYFIKKAFITEYRDLYERTEGDFMKMPRQAFVLTAMTSC